MFFSHFLSLCCAGRLSQTISDITEELLPNFPLYIDLLNQTGCKIGGSPTKLGHFRLWGSPGVYVGEYPEPQRQGRTILAVAISKDFPLAHFGC